MAFALHATKLMAAPAVMSLLNACGHDRRDFNDLSVNPETRDQVAVNHIHDAATSALRHGSGRKTVTVALGFGGAGKTGNDPAAGQEVYLFNLGQLEVGNSYGGTLGQTVASPKKAGEYYNMVAKVTESEDPSVALTALTTAFGSNKSTLSAALAEVLK